MNRQLTKNAILNMIRTVVNIIVPVIIYPYVSRVLGTDQIGIYNFSASIVSYAVLVAALGIPTYAIREGVRHRDDPAAMHRFVGEIFTINVISTVLSYLLLFGALLCFDRLKPYQPFILILSVEIAANTIGVSWMCNVYEDFLIVTVRTVLVQALSVVLIFLLVKTADDLKKYVIILAAANIASNLINCVYVSRRYCTLSVTKKISFRTHMRPILILFMTSAAITLYVNSDTTILGILMTNSDVGIYGTAVKIYTVLKNILVAILMVMIPQFTLYFTKEDHEAANRLFSNLFRMLTFVMLPICVLIFFLSEDVITAVSGIEYIAGSQALRYLCVAVVFSLYAYMYTQCVLIPLKKESIVFYATMTSAVINIVLNFILIPLWGINAAAITTIIAEFVTFVICRYHSRGQIRLSGLVGDILYVSVGCVLVVGVCVLFRRVDRFWVRLIGSTVCSAAVYLALMIVTHRHMIAEAKGMFKKQ